jgi:alpha-L-fucosidase
MDGNGESIYGTKASPFGILPWSRCTQKEEKGNTILYFTVFDWPSDGKLNIPGFKSQVKSARLLTEKNNIKTSMENETLIIQLPKKAPDKIASVFKVEVKGKLE